MKTPRINTSFKMHTDSAFETKAQIIAAAMSDNEYFKNPSPEIPVLLDAINTYTDALTAAGTGDRIKIAEKNKSRKALEALLRELAAYVMLVAKGDRTILISSGFDLQKEPESKPAVTAPTTLIVKSGSNSGEVIVRAVGAKNVKHYRHEYTVGPLTENSVWIDKLNSKGKHMFEGLKPTVEHHFRTAGLGKDDEIAYSKVVSYIVQ